MTRASVCVLVKVDAYVNFERGPPCVSRSSMHRHRRCRGFRPSATTWPRSSPWTTSRPFAKSSTPRSPAHSIGTTAAPTRKIRRLYELGKAHNWNSTLDVDWDEPCDRNDFPSDPSLSAL